MATDSVIVIGAGASGMMAAGHAAAGSARVLLLEKTDSPGKKILISGKTRCNLTNRRQLDDFIAMYGPNGRFLYGAFNRFFRDELLVFFQHYGVATQVERGGRVFPVSGDAADIVRALRRYLSDGRVELRTGVAVDRILVEDGRVRCVHTSRGVFPAAAVVLAAGGATYPATGSSGDGFHLAQLAGHTITRLRPALVPLVVEETETAKSMQGVSLRNVRLTAYRCPAGHIDRMPAPQTDTGRGTGHERPPRGIVESRMGELMLTHFGIGGPVTLQMSLAVVEALEKGPVSVAIDLKPALTRERLERRLQRDFEQYANRGFKRILGELLPQKMIAPFVEMSGIAPDKPGRQVTVEERRRLLGLVKSLRFNIRGTLPLSAAMVTAGGVSLKEIEPKTMASRLVKGLYLCGEVIDIDGDTGGYNLQAAFSTGWVAGEEAAKC